MQKLKPDCQQSSLNPALWIKAFWCKPSPLSASVALTDRNTSAHWSISGWIMCDLNNHQIGWGNELFSVIIGVLLGRLHEGLMEEKCPDTLVMKLSRLLITQGLNDDFQLCCWYSHCNTWPCVSLCHRANPAEFPGSPANFIWEISRSLKQAWNHMRIR